MHVMVWPRLKDGKLRHRRSTGAGKLSHSTARVRRHVCAMLRHRELDVSFHGEMVVWTCWVKFTMTDRWAHLVKRSVRAGKRLLDY